ncbi:Gag-Pol polyprotein, partial [Schistosoma japonicum]
DLLNHKTVRYCSEDLTDFAIRLRSIHLRLLQIGYESDVNSTARLESIVMGLPIELQELKGREPSLGDLVLFVEERARVSRTRYGMLVHDDSMTIYGHVARKCGSGLKSSVKRCTVKHHSFLHVDGSGSSAHFSREINSLYVDFGTIPVRVCGSYGSMEIYAFLDSGSDTYLMCEENVNRLCLESKASSINVTTMNETCIHKCLEVSVESFSLDGKQSVQISKAYAIKKLPLGHAEDVPFPQLRNMMKGILVGCDIPGDKRGFNSGGKPEKLRIVFGCAAKYHDLYLNNQLLRGPNTVNSLIGVLLRFRLGRIALAADIEEMFLQVRIPEGDRGTFRLEIVEFCLTVYRFGAVSSLFCANFFLRRTVDMFCEDKMEDIRRVTDKNLNVYDYLASTDSVHDAVTLAKRLGSILRKGGFRLTKWISNCFQVIESIPLEEQAVALKSIDFEKIPIERLLAPVILPAKQLLQCLCKSGLRWDMEIPENEKTCWFEFLDDMQKVENISFPRCMLARDMDHSLTELHVFSDASEVRYGAVAHSRCYVAGKEACCRLISVKPRVAPLKTQTIQHLKLTAAVLAARIGSQLQTELDREFADVVFWTDSIIVLNYIRNESSQF